MAWAGILARSRLFIEHQAAHPDLTLDEFVAALPDAALPAGWQDWLALLEPVPTTPLAHVYTATPHPTLQTLPVVDVLATHVAVSDFLCLPHELDAPIVAALAARWHDTERALVNPDPRHLPLLGRVRGVWTAAAEQALAWVTEAVGPSRLDVTDATRALRGQRVRHRCGAAVAALYAIGGRMDALNQALSTSDQFLQLCACLAVRAQQPSIVEYALSRVGWSNDAAVALTRALAWEVTRWGAPPAIQTLVHHACRTYHVDPDDDQYLLMT
jgi:hypothetical protein